MTGTSPRVVVVVTEGCHLCEDATATVSSVCDELQITWGTQDLFGLAAEQVRQWRDFVPVVLIDGAVHDMFRVTPDRLRAALR